MKAIKYIVHESKRYDKQIQKESTESYNFYKNLNSVVIIANEVWLNLYWRLK